MKTEQQMREEQAKILSVLRRNFDRLTGLIGVTGSGIGLRMKGGSFTDEVCIYLEVEKKLPFSALDPSQVIPPSVEGVPIDVIERVDVEPEVLKIRPEELKDDENRYRPLVGGIQITNGKVDSHGRISVGTLGFVVEVRAKKRTFFAALSNHHVMYANGAGDGNPIMQPKSAADEIAKNHFGQVIPGDGVDVAIAEVNSGVQFVIGVRDIGRIVGFQAPYVGQGIRKRGRTTELTTGTITHIGVRYEMFTPIYTGLTAYSGYRPTNPNERFTKGGDSGSAYVSFDNWVVGLHYAGIPPDRPGPFPSFANDIRRIVRLPAEREDLSFLELSPEAMARLGRVRLNPDFSDSDRPRVQLLSDTKRLERYAGALQRTEAGRELLAAVHENWKECVRLVNEQRECMVAWLRMKGPDFISLDRDLDPAAPYLIRKEIDGIRLEEMLVKMEQLFRQHGSEALRRAFDRHGETVLESARTCGSMEEIVATIAGSGE